MSHLSAPEITVPTRLLSETVSEHASYEGPDVKTDFRNRLGLQVASMKGKSRTFVVEHIYGVPTETATIATAPAPGSLGSWGDKFDCKR